MRVQISTAMMFSEHWHRPVKQTMSGLYSQINKFPKYTNLKAYIN